MKLLHIAAANLLALGFTLPAQAQAQTLPTECDNWQANNPAWLWCDDFESDAALEQNYFEVNRVGGRFGVTQEASYAGNGSIRGTFIPGNSDGGNIKLSLGRSPVAQTRYTDTDFQELYWRFYMMVPEGWEANGEKVTRGIIFSRANWGEAAAGHIWQGNGLAMGLDPVSLVHNNQAIANGYNDWGSMKWLGAVSGNAQVYAPAAHGQWQCVEIRMKLNTPGQSDGILTMWVNDQVDAQRTGLDWRESYTDYGINAIFLENWMNNGPPKTESRYFDNFVVSTQRIGCYDEAPVAASQPLPPFNIVYSYQ